MLVAIIPARGGSKRIPKKNIKLFHGKPIIAYAIEAALASGIFSKVIVSTENEEIAKIARQFGAEVPFLRSAENADDFATTSAVLLEVIHELEKDNVIVEHVCCLYPTSPLIDSIDLKNANEKYAIHSYDTLISYVPFGFPIQRSFQLSSDNLVLLNQPELINQRSQDLTKNYHDAGAMYFLNVAKFKTSKSLWIGMIGGFELAELKVQDIDTIEDWKIAELKYTILHQ